MSTNPWEVFDEEEEYTQRECSEYCGHYDSLNCCCWLSMKHRREGHPCDYGFSTQPYGDFKTKENEKQ